MKQGFQFDNALDFYVDKARSGGTWTNIAGPLTDSCMYVDPVKWNWNKDRNTFYRVRFEKDSEWQYSVPIQANGTWTREDYLLAKEIARKEYLILRKTGRLGKLLKKKEWGDLCTTCTDYDTEELVDTDCPKCLGTGIIGGYYAPIDMPLQFEPSGKEKVTTDIGPVEDQRKRARVVAYPFIQTGDIWIDGDSNERWRIRPVQTIAEVRGRPLIQKLELRMIPQTDVIYSEEANDLADSTPVEQPEGTEHTWDKNADCLNDFEY
jgi:hypothetical protein